MIVSDWQGGGIDDRPEPAGGASRPIELDDRLRTSIEANLRAHDRRGLALGGRRHAAVAVLVVDSDLTPVLPCCKQWAVTPCVLDIHAEEHGHATISPCTAFVRLAYKR